jgi:hypothetical protein
VFVVYRKLKWWLLPLISVEFAGVHGGSGCTKKNWLLWVRHVYGAVVFGFLPLIFCICDVVTRFGVVLPVAYIASVILVWLCVYVVPRNYLPPVV